MVLAPSTVNPVTSSAASRTPSQKPRSSSQQTTNTTSTKRVLSPSNNPNKLNPETALNQNDLETKLIQVNEMIDLLSLKMNALWQEFYNMGDNRTRDAVQQEISSTYQRLQQKREEAEKITKDLEKSPRKK
jgi:hypothetical protein